MPAGTPELLPTDGLTTRQRRQQLLIVHTGDGKSTAAFGLAARLEPRLVGRHLPVRQIGPMADRRAGRFESLGELHDATGRGGSIEWHKMGSGWSWSRKAGTDDDHAAAAEGWQEIKRRLAEEQHTLYVLDEFTYPINWGWVDIDDVIDTLTTRSGYQHVIITGRRADPSWSRQPSWSPR